MNFFNPWHDVDVGEHAPNIVHAVIEIPKDSHIKYELDKDTGMLKLDRFLYSAAHYPGDYGFIPRTLWDDGDPLDIIVITHRPVYPLTLTNARIVGVIRMIDGDERDDKIIAVYDKDPRYAEFKDIKDIPQHILKELVNFFERYKELQGKQVKVLEIMNREIALKDIEIGQKLYREMMGKKKK
jgi:inorganic pyrophosphatase